jgi:preprotein translocase subunit YajC
MCTYACSATSTKVRPVVISLRYGCAVAHTGGLNGQVASPQKFRDELGIEPGDKVEISLSENGVLIQSVNTTKSLRGIFSGSGMLEMLMSERRND